uniref:Uncharacterized protein n=1 Tax=Solanum tuberosum TaxID=4113 RepID=M1AHW7_SOLTU
MNFLQLRSRVACCTLPDRKGKRCRTGRLQMNDFVITHLQFSIPCLKSFQSIFSSELLTLNKASK